MQGGVGDGDATDEHRLESGYRGHGTGTANLKLDVLEQGHLFLGRELVSLGPARRPGHEAQSFLQGDRIDLVDHSVDLIGESGPAAQDVVVVCQTASDPLLQLHLRADG
ncbi:hypothetical protein D3C81_1780770 [compost metagenome]